VHTEGLEQVWQPARRVLQIWQAFEEMAKLVLTHAVQTDALEQTVQLPIRELQAIHAPPCKMKPELHVRQAVELEHVAQLEIKELQSWQAPLIKVALESTHEVQTEALEQALQLGSELLQREQAPADRKEPEIQERHALTELQVAQLTISEAQVTHLLADTT
jgi:vacuolar-type H+-ATPase subunit H